MLEINILKNFLNFLKAIKHLFWDHLMIKKRKEKGNKPNLKILMLKTLSLEKIKKFCEEKISMML
jgi:hypothetical protein